MKAEIVPIRVFDEDGDSIKYAVRYKRWWQFSWRYLLNYKGTIRLYNYECDAELALKRLIYENR